MPVSNLTKLSLAALLLAPAILFAEIYDKREIKPWFSMGGEARFQQTEGINNAVFGAHRDLDNVVLPYFSRFGLWTPPHIGVDLGTGVEYGQFVMGFHLNFNVPQRSNPPVSRHTLTWEEEQDDGTVETQYLDVKYQSAKYYLVGLDFSFGWMLGAPESIVNLISTVRFGFSILNVRWPADYPMNSTDGVVSDYRIGKSYYSSAGRSVTPELELRLRLSEGVRLGLYGGYRYTLIDHINIAATPDKEYFHSKTYNDIDASNGYVGLRLSYVLRSAKEKARDFSKE